MQWLDVTELEVTTRERYDDLIRLYILPPLGDKKNYQRPCADPRDRSSGSTPRRHNVVAYPKKQRAPTVTPAI
ncbi:MAG: hypothetical protein QOJ73_7614, partial [Streptosporangiaceae bacterium]|nr:hypothetical protein [Streptosporangiaceae bacterium]